MPDESSQVREDIYRRLNTAEKEIYAMGKELLYLQSAKPAERIGMLEATVQQIRLDVVSMEKISADMSDKLGKGLDDLKTQAAISRAQMRWVVAGGSAFLGIMAAWPVLKELIKAVMV